ncbi:MAG: hypothetical protein LM590_14030 [Thermofilum sp.]|jgi:hypothetical protein|nr:hypothetical protein [Thermofilum sp.]
MSAKEHGRGKSWTDIVVEALKSLGAEQKAVLIQEIYDAVRKIAPSMCDDRNIYTHVRGNVSRSEPRWKKSVRNALHTLKRRGLVTHLRTGLWKLADT